MGNSAEGTIGVGCNAVWASVECLDDRGLRNTKCICINYSANAEKILHIEIIKNKLLLTEDLVGHTMQTTGDQVTQPLGQSHRFLYRDDHGERGKYVTLVDW